MRRTTTAKKPRIRRKRATKAKTAENPSPKTFIPTGELGRVTVIRYVRRGKPDVEFEHKFNHHPVATYDAKTRCLLIEGVEAGPV